MCSTQCWIKRVACAIISHHLCLLSRLLLQCYPTLWQFISVQFHSRWYPCTQESPYVLHPMLDKKGSLYNHLSALVFTVTLAIAVLPNIVVVQLSSVLFKMVSMHSAKPICAPPNLASLPSVIFETIPMLDWLTFWQLNSGFRHFRIGLCHVMKTVTTRNPNKPVLTPMVICPPPPPIGLLLARLLAKRKK